MINTDRLNVLLQDAERHYKQMLVCRVPAIPYHNQKFEEIKAKIKKEYNVDVIMDKGKPQVF